jgi:rhodanese-related sulfurtransferase
MRLRPALAAALVFAAAAVAAAQYAPGRMEIDEFRKLHAAGKILVVDVRDEQSFRNGHIPASINIPLGEHERAEHFNTLKGEKRPIVTYCA